MRYPLLAVAVSATCSTLAVADNGQTAAINDMWFGGNQNYANYDNLMNSPAHEALVGALGVKNLRYIGGSPSSFWDWQAGGFIPENEITNIWSQPWFVNNGANDWVNARPAGTFTTDRFVDFAARAGVQQQWVVNLTTRENDADDMISFVDNLDGGDVTYIEADNEAYFWTAEWLGGRGGRYGNRIGDFAQSIRTTAPNAKIGANFRTEFLFGGEITGNSRTDNWNDEVWATRNTPGRPAFDALILHHYEMNGDALENYAAADARGAFLAFPQVTIGRAANIIEQLYDDLPIWITEYNVIAYSDNSPVNRPNEAFIRSTEETGWNALYTAGFLLTALQRPDDIEVMNFHAVEGGNGWALGDSVGTTSGLVSPAGVIFSHLSHLTGEAKQVVEVEPDSNPSLGFDIEGLVDPGVFQTAALRNDDGSLVFLIMNRDDGEQAFNLDGLSSYDVRDRTTYLAEDADANGLTAVNLTLPIWAQDDAPFDPTLLLGNAAGSITSGQLSSLLPGYSLSILTLDPDLSNPGDANDDGTVSILDFAVLRSNFGQIGLSGASIGDFNFDGVVSILDFAILRGNFGNSVSASDLAMADAWAASVVPEPATAGVVAMGGLLLLRRRVQDV